MRANGPLLFRLEARLGETGVLLAFLLPALVLLVFAQFYPLVYSAVISFYDWTLSRSPLPGGFVGLANYEKAIADHVFVGSITMTVVFAISSTLLQMSLGLGLALLTVGEGLALKLGRTLLMLPMVVAPVAVGTIWRMLLSARVGPVNQLLASLGIDGPNWLGDPTWAVVSLILIDAWEWLPFVTIIYIAALTSLPGEVLKAAVGRRRLALADLRLGDLADAAAGNRAGGDVPADQFAAHPRPGVHHHLRRPGLRHPYAVLLDLSAGPALLQHLLCRGDLVAAADRLHGRSPAASCCGGAG